MPKLSVSRPPQSDLRAIARYTLERRGATQAVKYAQGLQALFQSLAEHPGLGRACDAIRPGLQRHEHGKYVVFYQLKPDGVRIVRVLHQQMLPVKSHFGL